MYRIFSNLPWADCQWKKYTRLNFKSPDMMAKSNFSIIKTTTIYHLHIRHVSKDLDEYIFHQKLATIVKPGK